ncbi:MAG TPA: cytochrome ubiquinol oxidase subunit I [Alphaproteobacteria bacterium]|nr:cytochrome ubiquinol oxidase subunit I [Alphaproteobacteria bacterium]
MIDFDVVALSRLQFGLTAMYHFLFVPLTIGLSVLMAIMETVYVMTGQEIWCEMTKFWGKLFGINFAMGVATGITLEFQFGTNWAYYSHYVGDVFGVPLAIEGMMAFFLESTFIGVFFFGWTRLSRRKHLAVTWLVAIGANLSALWILIANAWMQNPVGAKFSYETMRMELTSLWEVFFNPVAQAKFVHTVSASYVTGATFVLSISAFYLLRNRHREFARRSMVVAASFGLASALSVAVLGDESGYALTDHQKMKLAAIEAMWETEKAPAAFTIFGWPDEKTQTTKWAVRVPYMLGIIATRSLNTELPGIKDQVKSVELRIKNGIEALKALRVLRKDKTNVEARRVFETHGKHMGYALLLRRHIADPVTANQDQIKLAALDTVPSVLPLFWTFRLMVGIGFFLILLFAWAFIETTRRRFGGKIFRWIALLSLPLPWVAAELGWFVAEHGRQPWVIEGLLPTFMGASGVPLANVIVSLVAFVLFYSALLIVDIFLMVKYVRLGPQAPAGRRRLLASPDSITERLPG